MIFDKYRKTFEMYKENKKRLDDANLTQTEINNKSRITKTRNDIAKVFKESLKKRKSIFNKKN